MTFLTTSPFPSDWTCESILQGCARVTSGGTPSRKNKSFYTNGTIPWVKTKELLDRLLWETEEKITEEAIEKSSAKILPHGTILLAMYGATVGKLGLTRREMACNQACCALIPDNDSLDTDFLFYFLLSNRENLINLATGSAQQNISAALVKDIAVPKPSITEQRRIGNLLRTLDNKIEVNQKMNQTLEEIAKAVFKSWFIDFDPVYAKAEGRPTGLPSEVSDLFPDELVDSEIGKIPKGWDVLKVKDEAIRLKVGKLYSNKTVEEEGSIPVLDQSAAGIIGYHSNDEFVSASLDDPVFTFANHTCKMRLLFSDFGVIQNVIPLKPKSYPTIWFYLRTLDIKQFEEYKGHIPDFMETQLCFPCVSLAESLDRLVTPLFHRICNANEENKVLSELRDTLLPKLISGELRVPDAEKFLEEAGV
jgi:type I restriction enzyme, S subunit